MAEESNTKPTETMKTFLEGGEPPGRTDSLG